MDAPRQSGQAGPGDGGHNGDAGEAAAKRAAEEQMRRDVLSAILEPAARERRMSLSVLTYGRSQRTSC
jgi:programmed cell death protein 5